MCSRKSSERFWRKTMWLEQNHTRFSTQLKWRFRLGSSTTNVDNLGGHCYWEGAHTRLIKTHKQQPGERYQTPARQQVNGSSGTFDEILSNHSPGFTMSRVTSPKFPGPAILEGRVFRQDTFRKMGPLLLDSIVINGVFSLILGFAKGEFFTDCTVVHHH